MTNIIKYLISLADKEHYTVKLLHVFIFVILVALMFPSGKSTLQEYESGAIWTDDNLVAEFSFPIYKDEESYKKECNKILENIYDIYSFDESILQFQFKQIELFFNLINTTEELELANILKEKNIDLSKTEFEILSKINQSQLKDEIKIVLSKIYQDGISNDKIDSTRLIIVRNGINEELVSPERFINISEVNNVLNNYFIKYFKSSVEFRSLKIKITNQFVEPNFFFQKEKTDTERKNAISNIPITSGSVSKGDKIVSAGDIITPEILLKIKSLEKINYEKLTGLNRSISLFGKILYVFFIISLFAIYLFFFEKNIFFSNSSIFLILLVIIVECFISYCIVSFELPRTYRLLVPIPLVGLLFTILFNSYAGFLASVLASFLVSAIFGNDYSFQMQMLIGGAVSVISVSDVIKRTQIFRSMFFVFIGFAIYLSIHSLILNSEFSVAGISLLFSGLNAVFSSLNTYLILILLENYFSFSTNFSLINFDDLNHPLLKKLSQNAVGTFNHSLIMSALSNAAASSIGANSILAKVGALFHDIGKLENPTAFNENQFLKKKNQSKLNPKLQVQIIKKHVEDGINLAKKEKLPNSIINFIPMHHGTRMVGNYFNDALQLKNKNVKYEQSDFRYSGPRPNTKETAIVMLADAVEASTRALKNPTIKSIEENINNIIEERLREGELDEAPLTIRDLAKIKSSFLRILVGSHHTRLVSPSKIN